MEELKSLYGTFVEAAIPPGDAPLTGGEAVLIQNFKAALGLQDVDAAPVHIDVGRRILRGRLEAGSRGEDIEARKVYISSVFCVVGLFHQTQVLLTYTNFSIYQYRLSKS